MTRKEMEKVVQDMIAAKSCYPVLRARGEEWLNAGDTDTEEAAWKKLVAQAKVDIMQGRRGDAAEARPGNQGTGGGVL